MDSAARKRPSRRLSSCSAWLSAVVIALVALFSDADVARAQVRPDSTKRDTLPVRPVPAKPDSAGAAKLGVPVVTGAPALPKPGSPEDSLMQKRIRDRSDSIAKFRAGDTVRAPIARFEPPPDLDLDDRWTFDKKQILSSGAINIADLLDRVPGVTSFRTGWMAGIHAASFHGDFSRIRFFIDGVEMDAVEGRNGGILDLNDLPLWSLDEIRIERAAGEVRVWMRSASYTKTIPFTRVDIFTGDRNTNGFRGLFARRYSNGFIVQFGAQQAATQTGRVSAFTTAGTSRTGGDGTNQAINTRLGWSRGKTTFDLYATANVRDRDAQTARKDFTNLPAFKGSRRDAYLRAAYGDTSRGFWTQAVLAVAATKLEGIKDSSAASVVADADSVALASSDTLRARSQQMVAIGYRAANWQYSFVNRVRAINGRTVQSPALRGTIGSPRLGASLYAEHRGVDSTTRIDATARMEPLKWLVLSLAQSVRSPSSSTERSRSMTTRLDAGLRFRKLLLHGGIVREDSVSYFSPQLLGTNGDALQSGPATAFTGGVKGKLYKDLHLDVQGMRWNTSQFGRPQLNVRTELALISDWRSHFPKGEFGFNARLIYDRRGSVPFFYGAKTDGTADIRVTVPANVLSGLVEIRIQRATLFYMYRNLTGGDYEQIPGLTMPPAVQMYGVRWDFFN